jgi:hypothetical protein
MVNIIRLLGGYRSFQGLKIASRVIGNSMPIVLSLGKSGVLQGTVI